MIADFEHSFPCSAETFWQVFLSPEFSRAFWIEKTGASAYQLLHDDRAPSGDRRRVFQVSLRGLELPGPLANLVSGSLRFTEEGTYCAARGHYDYRQTYSALSDRIKVTGTVSVRSGPDDRTVLRKAAVECTVKLFGLGALAERAAESNFKWGFAAEAAFAADWLERRRVNERQS
jgi:hypothetical protein